MVSPNLQMLQQQVVSGLQLHNFKDLYFMQDTEPRHFANTVHSDTDWSEFLNTLKKCTKMISISKWVGTLDITYE
jgi:hypothetical protein